MGTHPDNAGVLYVAATPIGNLDDASDRLKQVLRSVDTVVAEDTRRTKILLRHCEANPSVLSFHAHSDEDKRQQIVDRLVAGGRIALVTDAGTPGVSDPGPELVSLVRAMGITVIPIPGPSAVVAALSASGLPAGKFTFLGFLPRKGRERRELLDTVAHSRWTSIVYEAPGRLTSLLSELMAVTGPDRQVVVARELTKIYEELKSGTLSEVLGYYREKEPKGEITVLISGEVPAPTPVDPEALVDRGRSLLASGDSRRDAVTVLVREFGVSRNEAYRIMSSL